MMYYCVDADHIQSSRLAVFQHPQLLKSSKRRIPFHLIYYLLLSLALKEALNIADSSRKQSRSRLRGTWAPLRKQERCYNLLGMSMPNKHRNSGRFRMQLVQLELNEGSNSFNKMTTNIIRSVCFSLSAVGIQMKLDFFQRKFWTASKQVNRSSINTQMCTNVYEKNCCVAVSVWGYH